MSENACRHFKGFRGTLCGDACALGRDPRAWVARICGTDHGLFYKVPCTKQGDEHKPVFDCPGVDRKTQEDVDADRAAMSARMDRFVKALPVINKMRDKMVKNRLPSARATCPWCEAKDALMVTCAIGVNNHIHCKCESCGEGFME